MAELLPWLQLLLVPMVALLGGIRSDIAALRATQDSHGERIRNLERSRA